MNITELGAIGELVGGVAVIGSLIYVGLQIRHNAATTRAASHHSFTDSINQINLEMVRNPVVTDLWLRGTGGRSDLDANERHRFDSLLLSFFHVFEALFYQSQSGAGDQHLAAAEERSLVAMLSTTGIGEWWLANPYSFGDEFRQYVESFVPSATSPSEGA